MLAVASLLAIVALTSAPERAATERSVALVSLRAPSDLVFAGIKAAKVAAQAVESKGGFKVLRPEEVERVLGQAKNQELVDCAGNASCVAWLARPLGVARVISGRLVQVDRDYEVLLTLVEVESGRTLGTRVLKTPVAGRRLFREVTSAVEELLEGRSKENGPRVFSVEDPGVDVTIESPYLEVEVEPPEK